MIFYTKTGASSTYFGAHRFAHTSTCDFLENTVYWYDQHDASINRTPFNSFVDQQHWDHIRNDRTSKIVFFYGDEYFNIVDVKDWAETIIRREINPNQVYIICMDQNFAEWTRKKFAEFNVTGVNITHMNILLNRVSILESLPYKKRFSAFSRNYGSVSSTRPWRLYLFTKLYLAGVLENFNFTFNTIHPYPYVGFYPSMSKDKIIEHITNFEIPISPLVEKWVDGMPYTINEEDLRNKFSSDIYQMLQESGIHVVIESHFDPFWNFRVYKKGVAVQDFSPAFPTEKLFKAVGCNKPFIVFSTPYFLAELKNLGYKTFSPFINEEYDTIVDDLDRANAIIKEISRLNSLSEDKFQEVLDGCKDICLHNLAILEAELNAELKFTGEFEWLNESFLPLAVRK